MMLQMIAAGILLFSFSTGCEDDKTSPAARFKGTYRSNEPILVKIKTDYCTFNLQDVATIQWDVTWTVTETTDPEILNISMTYAQHDFTITNPECTSGAGYLPEPSPMQVKGIIDGNNLTIEYDNQEIGTFNFADNSFEGTMKYSYCIVFCQEIYTDQNNFSVEKIR